MPDASDAKKYKPVLGLSDEPGVPLAVPARAGTVFDQPEPEQLIELTVIVPARNEEQSIGECLKSLVAQSENVFELARSFPGVSVAEAANLEKGWTGKNSAIWTAARRARGKWILFTDADTIHDLGDLRRAMHEAARHKAGKLSYS